MFKVYDKNQFNGELSLVTNLKLREIECKCEYEECHYTLISERVLRVFDCVRGLWLSPLYINSGFRCQKHNIDIGGVKDSYHTIGCALDIRPKNPKEDLDELYKLCVKFFDVVIIYKEEGFLHCHMEEI